MTTQRIQLSRKNGWRLPPNTVKVDRSTKWGNPYRADAPTERALRSGAKTAAEAFGLWLKGLGGLEADYPDRRAAILAALVELRGKHLACWCRPGEPCHADVLLELARDAVAPTSIVAPTHDHRPDLALAVRQPWAWAIVFGGKDIENRDWRKLNPGLHFRGRFAIHASAGMTRDEYEDARESIEYRGLKCPPAIELKRGGIIGTVEVVEVVRKSTSPWFRGPVGLVLRNPIPCAFVPVSGVLGFFSWRERTGAPVRPSARWMLPERPKQTVERQPKEEPPSAQGVLL